MRGYGRARTPDNPTVQPLDYATAVMTVVIVIWILAAVWLAVRLVRRRST